MGGPRASLSLASPLHPRATHSPRECGRAESASSLDACPTQVTSNSIFGRSRDQVEILFSVCIEKVQFRSTKAMPPKWSSEKLYPRELRFRTGSRQCVPYFCTPYGHISNLRWGMHVHMTASCQALTRHSFRFVSSEAAESLRPLPSICDSKLLRSPESALFQDDASAALDTMSTGNS